MKNTVNLRVCGRENSEVSVADLALVKTPEATDSHFPIPHAALVENLKGQLAEAKLNVVSEYHTLARYGQRYFGLFEIDMAKPNATSGTVIGLRNSHDKSFVAGVCAGNAPFVCDNLCFSNEVTLGRKHTTNIMRDLPAIISRAIGKLGDLWIAHENRVSRYKTVTIDSRDAHDLVIRSFHAGAIGKTMIADVIGQWDKPNHDDFADRNLWSLHNAFSEVWKGNLVAMRDRSASLHSILDPFAGLTVEEQVIEV